MAEQVGPWQENVPPIDKELALSILEAEVENAKFGSAPTEWIDIVRELSTLAEQNYPVFPLPMLATAILARATDDRIDPFSLQVGDRKSRDPGAYSARRIADGVLAKHCRRLGIDIGSISPNPLNRATLQGIRSIKDRPHHANVKTQEMYGLLTDALARLEGMSADEARGALRAYIQARPYKIPQIEIPPGALRVSARSFAASVQQFVSEDSDGGKRAQAVVAGLFSAIFPGRVRTSGVNDPDRRFPGDVAITTKPVSEEIMIAVEVRDKAVSEAHVGSFADKCAEQGIDRFMVVAVAKDQTDLPEADLAALGEDRNLDTVMFTDWHRLMSFVVFGADGSRSEIIKRAATQVLEFLREMRASEASIHAWGGLVNEWANE